MQSKALNIQVIKYYTNVDGTIIDKNTIDPSLQVKVPFFMWGKFDKDGAYSQALRDTPPDPNLKFFNVFLAGSNDFIAFSGANEVKELVRLGDILLVFTDDLQNPNLFIWIVISANSQPYASILQNLDGSIINKYILYNSTIPENFDESLRVLHLSKLGDILSDPYSPDQARDPFQRTQVINQLRIDLTFPLDVTFGINSYILFESDQLTFNYMLDIEDYGQ